MRLCIYEHVYKLQSIQVLKLRQLLTGSHDLENTYYLNITKPKYKWIKEPYQQVIEET